LKDLGCELGQGFYFARPMTAAALLEYFGERIGPIPTETLSPVSGD
jgi:EAL domain-containing protein (putative c-di-GMP-specific phosphodiesterase class I)